MNGVRNVCTAHEGENNSCINKEKSPGAERSHALVYGGYYFNTAQCIPRNKQLLHDGTLVRKQKPEARVCTWTGEARQHVPAFTVYLRPLVVAQELHVEFVAVGSLHAELLTVEALCAAQGLQLIPGHLPGNAAI